MHGPDILARFLQRPGPPDRHGNRWQYHSRSDRHSKVGSWGVALDLLATSSLLRRHAEAGKVFPTEAVSFSACLLLLSSLEVLLLFLCLPSFMRRRFLGRDDLVLDIFVVVGPSAGRAQAVHVVLDIVVAELTYLLQLVSLVAFKAGGWQGSKPDTRKDKA